MRGNSGCATHNLLLHWGCWFPTVSQSWDVTRAVISNYDHGGPLCQSPPGRLHSLSVGVSPVQRYFCMTWDGDDKANKTAALIICHHRRTDRSINRATPWSACHPRPRAASTEQRLVLVGGWLRACTPCLHAASPTIAAVEFTCSAAAVLYIHSVYLTEDALAYIRRYSPAQRYWAVSAVTDEFSTCWHDSRGGRGRGRLDVHNAADSSQLAVIIVRL